MGRCTSILGQPSNVKSYNKLIRSNRDTVTPQNVVLYLWEHVLPKPNASSAAGKRRRLLARARKTVETREVGEEHDVDEENGEGEGPEDTDEEGGEGTRRKLSEEELKGLGEIAAASRYAALGVAASDPSQALGPTDKTSEQNSTCQGLILT